MVKEIDTENLEEMVMSLGNKIIEVAKNTKRELLQGDTPIPLHVKIDSKRRMSAILEAVKRSSQFSETLEALSGLHDFRNETQYLVDIIDEFAVDITNVICDGQHWDQAWVEHELTLMTEAFLMGVLNPRPDNGILIPLQNIRLYEFQLDLGEFGILRRATYAEKVKFPIQFPDENQTSRKSRFRYVLDVGTVDSESLFPVPNRHLKVLERTIFGLRIFYGGYVGVDYIHYWSTAHHQQNETATFTIPISHYLQSRFIGSKQDETSVYCKDAVALMNTIRKIHELNEDSFYVQAFRRYGASLYTLDFGFGDAVVDSVIALECLFGDNKPKAIQRILEITRPKKRDIRWELDSGMFGEVREFTFETLLERCWTARNKIAHGKSSDVAKEEAKLDPFYLSRIAQLLLRYGLLSASELGFPESKNLRTYLNQRIDEEK